MSAQEKTKIIYCGLDLTAWKILSCADRFDVVAVNLIPDFMEHRTFNPVDSIFKFVYALRISNVSPAAEKILSAVYDKISFLSSAVYRKYAGYLSHICHEEIAILDFAKAEEIETFVRTRDISMIIVNNWWMLPDKIINAPSKGTVNIHPSRLPQYRGSLPTLWTLKNKDAETAVSLIRLARKMDSGDIIAQYPISIDPQENAASLEGKVEDILNKYLEKTLVDYIEGNCPPIPQREDLACTTARYYDYMEIDWQQEKSRDIADKINLYPYLWPRHFCWTTMQGKKMPIQKAEVCSDKADFLPAAAGSFRVKGVYIYVRSLEDMIRMRLFRDIAFIPSIVLLLKRHGKIWRE